VFSNKGIARLWQWLFGPRTHRSPAESYLQRRDALTPEEVLGEHFAAIRAHDLEWITATLAPERAKLYERPQTLDKRRQTIADFTLHGIEATDDRPTLPTVVQRYPELRILRVEFSLTLVPREQRRDPSLQEGHQSAYYALVRRSKGAWMILDWGTQ
jgi:hypothetical protein